MSCSHVFYFIISDNNISFQELQPAITVTTFRQMSHCIVVLYFIQVKKLTMIQHYLIISSSDENQELSLQKNPNVVQNMNM